MKNKSKKMAIVSDAIYPYNKGGKEKRIYEISTRLAKAGYDVHIYCMKWWTGKSNIKKVNGVTLHAISKLYPLYSGERRSFLQAIFFSLACFKLIKEDFDLIDADHMPHLILFPLKIVTLLKRKKLYATWNEVWGRKYWVGYVGLRGYPSYWAEWLSARMPDEIIAVSEHTKDKLKKELKVKQKIVVVPNGIDLSYIKSIKPSKKRSDVIFAGRLLKNKNVDFIIKSIALLKKKYPNITCTIIGNGPEKLRLKKIVEKLKLQNNVIFYDFLEKQEDLYAMMKSSKVFSFPSTREGFGIVALEANAAGLPVITVNHRDNATKDLIVNHKNGHVINLDEKELAKNIMKYLSSNPATNNYIKSVEAYDWHSITKQVVEVYLK